LERILLDFGMIREADGTVADQVFGDFDKVGSQEMNVEELKIQLRKLFNFQLKEIEKAG
jgi:hypothetical protein